MIQNKITLILKAIYSDNQKFSKVTRILKMSGGMENLRELLRTEVIRQDPEEIRLRGQRLIQIPDHMCTPSVSGLSPTCPLGINKEKVLTGATPDRTPNVRTTGKDTRK